MAEFKDGVIDFGDDGPSSLFPTFKAPEGKYNVYPNRFKLHSDPFVLTDEDGTRELQGHLENEIHDALNEMEQRLSLWLRQMAIQLGISMEELAERYILEMIPVPNYIYSRVDGKLTLEEDTTTFVLKREYRLRRRRDGE